MSKIERLTKLGISDKVKTITLYYKKESNLYAIEVDNEHIMSGNHWDFHPNCHGIHKYGDFKGPYSLIKAIENYYKNDFAIIKERKEI